MVEVTTHKFLDRRDAGRALAARLSEVADEQPVVSRNGSTSGFLSL